MHVCKTSGAIRFCRERDRCVDSTRGRGLGAGVGHWGRWGWHPERQGHPPFAPVVAGPTELLGKEVLVRGGGLGPQQWGLRSEVRTRSGRWAQDRPMPSELTSLFSNEGSCLSPSSGAELSDARPQEGQGGTQVLEEAHGELASRKTLFCPHPPAHS